MFYGYFMKEKNIRIIKKIKEQVLKLLTKSNSFEYSKYYNFETNRKKLYNEIISYQGVEKEYLINTCFCTFNKGSSNNLKSLINRISSFENVRSLENPNIVDNCLCRLPNKYINCIDKMLWFPFIFRILISFFNFYTLQKWKLYNNLETYINNEIIIYRISNLSRNNKYLILFLGLGGILTPFEKIIDFFVCQNYTIICPIYKPAHADCLRNFDLLEAEYYKVIYNYLIINKIDNIEILCWSLGGLLYKGFENYLIFRNNEIDKENSQNCVSKYLSIKRVFLIEPLISVRASIDTFFSQVRNFFETVNIFNRITNQKYKILNYLFAYIIHTEIGVIASNSFVYFKNLEYKSNINCGYSRFLFISSDDIIININIDKELIENNFDSDKIFKKNGYHGGWIFDNSLIQILNQIV